VCAALALLGCACASNNPEPDQDVERPEEERREPLRNLISNTGQLTGMPSPESGDMSGIVSGQLEVADDDLEGNFLVAPVPFLNPTIGVGLALGAAYMKPFGKNAPPSTIGGGVMYSDNGTRGVALGFKGYFDEDRYRLTVGVASVIVNYDLTVEGGTAVPLRQEVIVLGVEFLVRAFERVFIGPQVMVSGLDTELRRDEDAGAIPEEELEADSIALGLRAQRDTRDSTFYPREGSLSDVQVRAYDEALGSTFSYRVVPLAYNAYITPREKEVIAIRGSARFAFGDVPFYGESFFGTKSDLRGYTVGTLHDNTLLAAQAEYRREFPYRMGAVAFAGVGTVVRDLGALDEAEALPSVGFGLRVLLEKENHVNFRLDFAWGKDQSAIYFWVGEAF